MSDNVSQIGLRKWIWRAFVQSALIPLVLVETILIACYLFTNQAIRESQLDYLERTAIESLSATADQNAKVIQDQLAHISDTTRIFSEMTSNALLGTDQKASEEFGSTPEGSMFSKNDFGGAASFYSSVTIANDKDFEKVRKLSSLDPLMRAIKDNEPMVASIYFNSWDSYNRIYPWIAANEQYPHDMKIPDYNFYYLADAEHNPMRSARWTDVYLDPAGHGWMMSAIAPVYRDDFLEGVVGLDITVGGLLEEISKLKVPWGGYQMLVSNEMKLMVLPPKAEHDFDVSDFGAVENFKAPEIDISKIQDFDRTHPLELRELAAAIAGRSRGNAQVMLKGRTHYVSWAEVRPAGWRLLAVADEEDVMAATNNLATHYRNIGYLMIGGLIIFYVIFFTYMWVRASKLSQRLRQPIKEIGEMLQQIGHGKWYPEPARSSIRELDEMSFDVLSMGVQLSTSEAERNTAQKRLSLVVESVTAGLWEYRIDEDEFILSDEFCRRLGLLNCKVYRRSFYNYVDIEDVQALDAALEALKLGRATGIDIEIRLLRNDGTQIWFLCRGRIFDEAADGHRLLAGTFVDIDTLKQVEEDLRRRTYEALGASKAKSRFISSMSHELRTPLNAVYGFAQLLRLQVEDGQENAQSLDEILSASRHLANLVDDLLDWSSLQADTTRLQLRVIEVGSLMSECAEMVRSQADALGLNLELKLPVGSQSVLGDARRLRQVMLNLLSNAIKYNRPHGRLRMGTDIYEKGRVRIFVEDGGSGISPDLQGALFEPFQRLGKENTAIQGTGIGLALCRELATLMGGSMGLYSELGVGSRFWIDLPDGANSLDKKIRRLSLYYVGYEEMIFQRVQQALDGLVDLYTGSFPECAEQINCSKSPDILLVNCDKIGDELGESLYRLRRLPGGEEIQVVLMCSNPRALATLGCEFQAVLKLPLEQNELRELVCAMTQVERSNV